VSTTQEDFPVLLSALPAPASQRRAALAVSLLLILMLVATAPFARVPWIAFPAFVPVQKTLMLVADLVTAALLFGQSSIERARTLTILAAGYLFTALITIPHMLTFPGVFSESGLLSAGPQSAAWLYIAWHGGLPVAAIAFALRRRNVTTSPLDEAGRVSIWMAVLAAVAAVAIITVIVTVGHSWLPSLIEGGRFTATSEVVVGLLLLLPLAALLMLVRRPSVLDVWLAVVMLAWFCTINVGAFLSGGRFDIGWYVGLLFDSLTSIFVLLVLLHETTALYARQFRSAGVEHRDRERRLSEMEAVLIHLSRVSELGQNVSALVHEVSQPLTAISNYAAASMQLAEKTPERVRPLLERLNEQAARATEIVRGLRDFIAQHETEKHVENLPDVLQRAVRLAVAGAGARAPAIEMRCSPAAAAAFIDRVQIEQVVFNLVSNAVEAMTDCPQRRLTIATGAAPDGMIEVSVADTGPGLAPEIRARLFQPFMTTKPGGLGIGLSICRVIVEAHGGKLEADSEPGRGATFRFTIPASPLRSATAGLPDNRIAAKAAGLIRGGR